MAITTRTFRYFTTQPEAIERLEEITHSRGQALELLGYANRNKGEYVEAYGAVVRASVTGYSIRRASLNL